MQYDLSGFKAYDLRGKIPDQLNEAMARDIGLAFADLRRPGTVVVGHDMRLSSPAICTALADGLAQAGVNVLHIGQCGTEEVYFATGHLQADGGIMVTASHNPADYNGMKFVGPEARPISADSGLFDIRDRVASGNFDSDSSRGEIVSTDVVEDYIHHLLGYVDLKKLSGLKLVSDPGNGGAGATVDRLARHLPFEFIRVHHEPDGTFPNGVPNPMLEENRSATTDAIVASGADFGMAWDGDFDRCFFFDENGAFIEGYYIVGLLADAMLALNPGGKIIYDPRLTWNTQDIVEKRGGTPVQSKSGHAFIKQVMREQDAVYGGEMSAHHYFRDFFYADSGMIPWLLVAAIVSSDSRPLSALVAERIEKFPCSGEINRTVSDAKQALADVYTRYVPEALSVDETDGYGFAFADWRFNLRMSNTEPVIRLNVESRENRALMQSRTAEILDFLEKK